MIYPYCLFMSCDVLCGTDQLVCGQAAKYAS